MSLNADTLSAELERLFDLVERLCLNGGKAQRLVLDGKEYSSVTRAAHARHVAPRRIYDWIAAGRGRFL